MNATTNAIKELPLTNEISAAVLGNATTKDGDFRSQLLNDPKQAIQDISTQPLPQDINILVAQNTEDTVHIPVPNYKELENNESHISDQELRTVSGGEIMAAVLAVIGTIGAIALVGGGVGLAFANKGGKI